jgi:hypothetical protein
MKMQDIRMIADPFKGTGKTHTERVGQQVKGFTVKPCCDMVRGGHRIIAGPHRDHLNLKPVFCRMAAVLSYGLFKPPVGFGEIGLKNVGYFRHGLLLILFYHEEHEE